MLEVNLVRNGDYSFRTILSRDGVALNVPDGEIPDWFLDSIERGDIAPDELVESLHFGTLAGKRTALDQTRGYRTGDDTWCQGCSNYVHRYLDQCLLCGMTRRSVLPAILRVERLERQYPRIAQRRQSDATLQSARERAGKMMLPPNERLRYLGDSPADPGPCDALITVRDDMLCLVDAVSKRLVVRIALSSMLAGRAFSRDTSISGGVVGMSFGNVTTFQHWKTPGGGMSVVYGSVDRPQQFSVANRDGWTTPKYPVEIYKGWIQDIGFLAAEYAQAAEAAMGAAAYARELGLANVVAAADMESVPRPTPTSVSSTKICPDCAEEIKADARLCRFCRHEFGAPAPDDEFCFD